MVIFGGRNSLNIPLNEFFFFVFDVDPTMNWNQLIGAEPQARYAHSIVSTSNGMSMFMFGGYTGNFSFNDVWELSSTITQGNCNLIF